MVVSKSAQKLECHTRIGNELRFLGHVIRKEGLEGRVDGKRARGRQRITYLLVHFIEVKFWMKQQLCGIWNENWSALFKALISKK